MGQIFPQLGQGCYNPGVDEERRERRSGGQAGSGQAVAVLALGALLLLPLYALSVGPALWLVRSGLVDEKFLYVFGIIYWPLEFLYNNVSFVEAFYDAYFRLLGVK